MAKPKIGIGVIGMGWMGAVHSRAYQRVADRFPDCANGRPSSPSARWPPQARGITMR